MKLVERPNLDQEEWWCNNDKASQNRVHGYNNCLNDVVPYIEYLEEQLKQLNERKIMPCSC